MKPLRVIVFILFLGFLLSCFYGLAVSDDQTSGFILKTWGALGAILGIVGISFAGYDAGSSYDSYTGWGRYTHGAAQFFNRKPFRTDRPTYEVTGDPKRLKWIDSLANRMASLGALLQPRENNEPAWSPAMGPEKLPE